jgi:hypothetical protein
MKVNIEIERSTVVPLPAERVCRLFDDLETTIGRFPKLRRLSKLGPDQYLWEMQTIGSRIAKIAHDVSYGAHYKRNAGGNELTWTPIVGKGNADVSGAIGIAEAAHGSELRFRVKGELRDVPVPLMYRLAAGPFIQGKFTALVETFLERSRDALIQDLAHAGKKKSAR